MRSKAKTLSHKVAFQGKLFQVSVDQVLEPGGIKASREVVCHGGSVVILPLMGHGKILLVRQFRYPAHESLWELVAGGIKPGETPAKAAARELIEETGCRASSFKPLLHFFPSPGFLTERMHLVEASGLVKGQAQPEADERIQPRVFTRRELQDMVRGGKIKDGKTLAGLLWFFNGWAAR